MTSVCMSTSGDTRRRWINCGNATAALSREAPPMECKGGAIGSPASGQAAWWSAPFKPRCTVNPDAPRQRSPGLWRCLIRARGTPPSQPPQWLTGYSDTVWMFWLRMCILSIGLRSASPDGSAWHRPTSWWTAKLAGPGDATVPCTYKSPRRRIQPGRRPSARIGTHRVRQPVPPATSPVHAYTEALLPGYSTGPSGRAIRPHGGPRRCSRRLWRYDGPSGAHGAAPAVSASGGATTW
jgi:hypothetical protein